MKFYLAGPMSGVPQFNLPLFDKATEELRRQGYEIVSPAELDKPDIRAACLASPTGASTHETNGGGTWGDFLARDVKLVSDEVDGVILLPDWQKSRGARLEVFVGLLCSKQFMLYRPGAVPRAVPAEFIRNTLMWSMP